MLGALARVNARVDIGDVRALLRRLGNVRVREVFRELRGPGMYDQRQHDRAQSSPHGSWPPLAPSTVARNRYKRTFVVRGGKKKGQRRTASKGWTRAYARKLLGRLPAGVKAYATMRALTIKSRAGWAIVHQAGGRAGHGARIPRRQFLWISDWLGQQAKKAFERAMMRAAAGVL